MILTIRNIIKKILEFSSIKFAAFSLLILISACNEKVESDRRNQVEMPNKKNIKVNERTFTKNSRTFNVLNYGAVGDDKTDATSQHLAQSGLDELFGFGIHR